MEIVTTCRFCNREARNHDHDSCASNYGKRIEDKILLFYSKGKKIPRSLLEENQSNRWKWYIQYKERLERAKRIESECLRVGETMHQRVTALIRKRGVSLLGKERKKFNITFEIAVKVTPKGRYM